MPANLAPLVGERPGGARCRVIALAGGRKGVGTSTVAALLALEAAALGLRTLLVEADAEDGALPRLLGRRGDGSGDGEHGVLTGVRDRLSLLRPAGWGSDEVARARDTLYGRHDLVVIDAGWRMDTVLDACAGGAERIVFVTTPEREALSACYGLIKGVEVRLPGMRFEVLVNRQASSSARTAFEQLQAATLTFLRRAVVLAGGVPEDACLRAGTKGGMPVDDAAADSEVALAVAEMAGRILAGPGALRPAWPLQ